MSTSLRILLLGGSGQIGGALRTTLGPLGDVSAPTRATLDCARLHDVDAFVMALRPDVVVNAAAYTRVDDAEHERAAAERMNGELPATLAAVCARVGANLLHYSTDYVFSGAQRRPYTETDATGPLSWYGVTKLAGDVGALRETDRALVLRTSWVYGHTGTNFVRTITRLAREREELRVVDDQTGSPTWSHAVARGTAALLAQLSTDAAAWRAGHGVWHMSAAGETTRHGFAVRALALDPDAGEHVVRRVTPVATRDYPVAARRPAYSALDCSAIANGFDVRLPHWEEQLAEMWRTRDA